MGIVRVGIFLSDEVDVLDFAGPYEVFSRTRLAPGVESRRSDGSAPFEVCTVATDLEIVTPTGGSPIPPGTDRQVQNRIEMGKKPPLLRAIIFLFKQIGSWC